MTTCPVCASLFQTIVVGPRSWGECHDCGARWVREGDSISVISDGRWLEAAGMRGPAAVGPVTGAA